jgi:hypothetical protein
MKRRSMLRSGQHRSKRRAIDEVPMARHFSISQAVRDARHAADDPGVEAPRGPLRILFMKSDVNGDADLPIGENGAPRSVFFPTLRGTGEELDTLIFCKTNPGVRPVEPITVIGDESPPLRGAALRQRLKECLENEHFDIFHFSGHSVSAGTDRGTYLIFPGESGTADPVSIDCCLVCALTS